MLHAFSLAEVGLVTSIAWAGQICQVDGQLNVGETQLAKFSSNRAVKSTLTAG